MADRALLFVVCLALALPACASDQVGLAYRFEDGSVHRYRYEVTSTRTLTTAGRTDRSESGLSLSATERVVSVRNDSAGLMLTITGEETVEGRTFDIPGKRIRMNIDATGAAAVTDATGSPELSQALLGIRPTLPREPVRIGSTWDVDYRVETEEIQMRLRGKGELLGFKLDSGRRLAEVKVVLSGPVTSEQSVGRSTATLDGQMRIESVASVDVRTGELFSSTMGSSADFKVAADSGVGRVLVRIQTSVQLV